MPFGYERVCIVLRPYSVVLALCQACCCPCWQPVQGLKVLLTVLFTVLLPSAGLELTA